LGVPKDAARAAACYREAAEKGLETAQFNLGFCYLHGDGLEQDDAEAVVWLTSAALQGYVAATAQLGTLYRFGRGVPQSIVMAAKLHLAAAIASDVASIDDLGDYIVEIEKEALAGSLRACLTLARMYDDGLAVEKSAAGAYAWIVWARRYGFRDDRALNEAIKHREAQAYGLVAIMRDGGFREAAVSTVAEAPASQASSSVADSNVYVP